MEISGGIAFGSAMAGGAIGGPMLSMSLPIAALVTSFLKNFSRRYRWRISRPTTVTTPKPTNRK